MIATHPFETARESVLPLWSAMAQVRCSAPNARAPDLFVLLRGMLFTNIQLGRFYPDLGTSLERLGIEEPEAREWTMMAAINTGALLEYGRAQGVLRCANVLGPLDRNPGAVAATKVKLARKAHTDERMEVDSDVGVVRSSLIGAASSSSAGHQHPHNSGLYYAERRRLMCIR